jgi:hypothetical protein
MANIKTIILFSMLFSVPLVQAYTDYGGTMRDFIGCNQNIRLLDKGYSDDFRVLFRWERDYASWSWFPYTWSGGQYTWNSGFPNYDAFTSLLDSKQINILMVVMGGYGNFGGVNAYFPKDNGDGSSPNHYKERINFMSQAASRYGASGNNRIRYFEDANEPDQWWWSPTWPADKFAHYMSGFHDGSGCTTDSSHPIMGIKTPSALNQHVICGGVNADEGSTGFLTYLGTVRSTLGSTRFNQAFDILNFHYYCGKDVLTPGGYAPEHETYGLKLPVDRMKYWRDSYASGKPIWITEFGWDTANANSFVYARSTYNDPEKAQANYLMRSLALLKGWGIDKAFIFMYEDPNTGGAVQFENAGMIKNEANGFAKKKSYYYLGTMANIIGDKFFHAVDKYKELSGSTEFYSYAFRDSGNSGRTFMVWCRQQNSQYDNATVLTNHTYIIPYMTTCTQTKIQDWSLWGTSTTLPVSNPGSATASVSIPQVSETPLFLRCGGNFNFPQTPTIIRATGLSTNSIYILWNNTPNETSFRLYRSTTLFSNGMSLIATTGQNVTNFTDSGRLPGTYYYYWIQAVNGSGASDRNGPVAGQTHPAVPPSPPNAPSGLIVAKFDSTSASLAWNDLSNETSYTLFRNTVDNSSTAVRIHGLPANSTSWIDMGLSPIVYYYWLKAYNGAGASPFSTGASIDMYTGDTGTTPPPAEEPDWDEIVIYPNPISLSKSEKMKFQFLPEKTLLTIYSLNGTIVFGPEKNESSILEWDCTNKDGGLLAPGVYRYLLVQGKKKKSGKLILTE